jgi:cytochrome c peroxidase
LKNNTTLVYCGIVVLLLLFSFGKSDGPTLISFSKPQKWPKPAYDFSKNPLTVEGFELGKKLFYDPILSRDSSISCASCHLQFTGFAHVDHAVSHGIAGRKGTRNAPSLVNLAWSNKFHWDGGVTNLELQALNPIQHPNEMDNSLKNVLSKLNNSVRYPDLFDEAFGERHITTTLFVKALAQFTVSLVSANSKYDRVKRKEKGVMFSEQEQSGYAVFKQRCAACHREPLFTNGQFASNGLPVDRLLHDLGRYTITQLACDSFQFKVPTLRNIEFTPPYMHDGRFKKLKDVITYYSDGIDIQTPHLSHQLKKPIRLNDIQKKDLLAFLLTLTDRTFLYDKQFSFPLQK